MIYEELTQLPGRLLRAKFLLVIPDHENCNSYNNNLKTKQTEIQYFLPFTTSPSINICPGRASYNSRTPINSNCKSLTLSLLSESSKNHHSTAISFASESLNSNLLSQCYLSNLPLHSDHPTDLRWL